MSLIHDITHAAEKVAHTVEKSAEVVADTVVKVAEDKDVQQAAKETAVGLAEAAVLA